MAIAQNSNCILDTALITPKRIGTVMAAGHDADNWLVMFGRDFWPVEVGTATITEITFGVAAPASLAIGDTVNIIHDATGKIIDPTVYKVIDFCNLGADPTAHPVLTRMPINPVGAGGGAYYVSIANVKKV